jgi:uncharacterized protein involved in response to NO
MLSDRNILRAKPIFTELLSYAFRPFFLLGSLCAIVVMVLWILALAGAGPLTTVANPMLWHAHEMLLGFIMAVVAGFVMTAVAMWTGRTRLNGAPLGWLVAAWLAGRCAMVAVALLPGWLVAVIDMLFPLLLVFFFSREIVAAGSRRNYVVVGIVVVTAILNLLYHAGATGLLTSLDRTALLLMIHVLLLLITAIAGRIVPSFTTNWLKGNGLLQEGKHFPRSTNPVEVATLLLTGITGCLVTFAPASSLTGIAAIATAAIHAFRLSRWAGLATRSEPLLFVLHIAYLWLPIGYLLMAWSVFGSTYPPSVAMHALTMGAISSMILAMTTRVALGHTGRALHAARLTVIAYVLLTLAVVVRIIGPLTGQFYMTSIEIAATGWIMTFALFIWVYWPILTQSRPEQG